MLFGLFYLYKTTPNKIMNKTSNFDKRNITEIVSDDTLKVSMRRPISICKKSQHFPQNDNFFLQ